MRDDSARWDPAAGLDREAFQTPAVTLKILRPNRQTLISGPYPAALQCANVETATGWPEAALGDHYAVRLRRDRILVINGDALSDGWHAAKGVAVSDMTGGYAMLALGGPKAFDLLRRGTEITPDAASKSVLRGFHGYPVMLYSHGAGQFRLHIPSAMVDGFWSLLADLARQLE